MTCTFDQFRQAAAGQGQASPRRRAALDWMESQSRVIGLWLDQLIAEGDNDELVSMLHRQQAWLDMMQARLAETGHSPGVRLAR